MTRAIRFTRPWLYPKQETAIFCPERMSLIEASTKSGKTFGCMVWLIEQALQGKPGQNFWWVGPVYDQSEIAFRRMKRMIPKDQRKPRERPSMIQLTAPETTIWYKTAEKPDSLYGEDVYAAVIDEASRCRDESWHALRTTVTATRAPIRMIGNVKGRRNWFYKLCRVAETGKREYLHYAKITAWDAVEAGILDIDEVLEAQETLPENVFRELYEAEAADDGGNPFGLKHIQAIVFRDGQNLPTGQLPDTEPVGWGWDLAKAHNYTVGIGLDIQGRVCRFERFQGPWELTFQRVMNATGAQTPAVIDSTPGSGGDPILERLHMQGYGNFSAFRFTELNKQALMLGLAAAIQRREIGIPAGVIVDELESFEYEYGSGGSTSKVLYRAGPGAHDDTVDALAMAVYCKQIFAPVHVPATPSVLREPNYYRAVG